MPKLIDNTVCDANTQTMRCLTCGDEVPFPMGDVSWFLAVMKAFVKAHSDENHSPGRTKLSKPVEVVK